MTDDRRFASASRPSTTSSSTSRPTTSWRRPSAPAPSVAGPIPLPTKINKYTRAPRTARRQEVARAVRDPHAQAPARHPRADAADPRRADEARSLGRRRRRDQDAEVECMATIEVFNLKREDRRRARPRRRASSAPKSKSTSSTRWSRRSSPRGARARTSTKERDEVAAAARSSTSRRAPAARARARPARRTTSAAARSSRPKPRDWSTTCRKKVHGGALRSRAVAARQGAEGRRRRQLRARRDRRPRLVAALDDARRPRRRWSSTRDEREARKSIAQPRRHAKFLPPEGVNVYDLLRHDTLIVTRATRRGRQRARSARRAPKKVQR